MHVINYLTTSETVYRKPHPKIFEDMIEQLGVKPRKLCMLEMTRSMMLRQLVQWVW